MRTVVTANDSIYELSDADEAGYVLVVRVGDQEVEETLRDDTFPMRAKVNGYDKGRRLPLSDIQVGQALQILPQWRDEANIVEGTSHIGILTSRVTAIGPETS